MRLALDIPRDASAFAGDLERLGISPEQLNPTSFACLLWLIRMQAQRVSTAALARAVHGETRSKQAYDRTYSAIKRLTQLGLVEDDLGDMPVRTRGELPEPPHLLSLQDISAWQKMLFLELLGLANGIKGEVLRAHAHDRWIYDHRSVERCLVALLGTNHIIHEAGAWKAAPPHREEYLQWIQQQQEQQAKP